MGTLGYIFGIIGYLVALASWRELKKTKKILSKYVNEENKLLLLYKPSKKIYLIAFLIGILVAAVIPVILFIMFRK